MFTTTDDDFQSMITNGIEALPKLYQQNIQNVAFLVEDEPSPKQRQELGLRCNQTLFGLYQGVPLPVRQGTTSLLPDIITIFKRPIEGVSKNQAEVAEQVRHTVWHEVAHYYGLDHMRIHELEK